MPDSTLSRRSAALMGAWTRPPLLPKTHKFHTETAGEPEKGVYSTKTAIEIQTVIRPDDGFQNMELKFHSVGIQGAGFGNLAERCR